MDSTSDEAGGSGEEPVPDTSQWQLVLVESEDDANTAADENENMTWELYEVVDQPNPVINRMMGQEAPDTGDWVNLKIVIRSTTGRFQKKIILEDFTYCFGLLALAACKNGGDIGFYAVQVRPQSLLVNAKNKDSRDWLLATVPTQALWGSNLTASVEPPARRLAELWLPNCDDPIEDVVERLINFNANLRIQDWLLVTWKYQLDGLKLHVGLYEFQVEKLALINFKPFYMMTNCTVTLTDS